MLKMARGGTHNALFFRLVAELGAAPITEAFITSETELIDGLCEGGSITIAPHNHIVDTVIHELLHRLYPMRSERSIRRTTSQLRKTLTDEEVQFFYDEYQRRKKTGKPRGVED